MTLISHMPWIYLAFKKMIIFIVEQSDDFINKRIR